MNNKIYTFIIHGVDSAIHDMILNSFEVQQLEGKIWFEYSPKSRTLSVKTSDYDDMDYFVTSFGLIEKGGDTDEDTKSGI